MGDLLACSVPVLIHPGDADLLLLRAPSDYFHQYLPITENNLIN